MKMIVTLAAVAACSCALAQQLPNRWLGRRGPDEKPQFLMERIEFSKSVELAKAGDGKGYFALGWAYLDRAGEDVDADAKTAEWMFNKSADAGDPNAAFVLELISELKRSAVWGYEYDKSKGTVVSRILKPQAGLPPYESLPEPRLWKYFGGSPVSVRSDGSPPLTNRADVIELRGRYEELLARGVSGARNELARIDDWLEGYDVWVKTNALNVDAVESAKRRRKENAELVASLLPVPGTNSVEDAFSPEQEPTCQSMHSACQTVEEAQCENECEASKESLPEFE